VRTPIRRHSDGRACTALDCYGLLCADGWEKGVHEWLGASVQFGSGSGHAPGKWAVIGIHISKMYKDRCGYAQYGLCGEESLRPSLVTTQATCVRTGVDTRIMDCAENSRSGKGDSSRRLWQKRIGGQKMVLRKEFNEDLRTVDLLAN
jgi:hypothetical protein